MKKIFSNTMLAGLLALIIFGCEESQDVITYDEVEAVLEKMIMEDPVFGLDELNNDEIISDDNANARLTKTVSDYCPDDSLKIKFGRRVYSKYISFNHEFFGDTLAITTVTHSITGEFITNVYDSSRNLIESFTKPFNSEGTRKVKFVPVTDSGGLNIYWRVAGLTLITGGAGTKVGIDSLKIFRGADNTLLYRFDAENVEDTYIDINLIPIFTLGDSLIFKMYINNNGPVYNCESGERGSFRFGQKRKQSNDPKPRRFHARIPFADDGIHGNDAVANDDEFSLYWFAKPLSGRRVLKGVVDIIDTETLFSSNGGYNTAFWGFPYRTVLRD